MNPDLHDKTWMSSGVSLLWDAEALNEICSPEAVRSLRELLRLHQAGWPESDLSSSKIGRLLSQDWKLRWTR